MYDVIRVCDTIPVGLLVLHLLAIMPWCVQHKQPNITHEHPSTVALGPLPKVPAPLVTFGQSPQGSTHPSFMHLVSQDELALAALDQPCLEQPSQK